MRNTHNLLWEVIVMKEIIRIAGLGVVCGIAVQAGYWLWDNVLEDKVEDFYDYCQKKKLKRYQ
jgi:hypothetical protein